MREPSEGQLFLPKDTYRQRRTVDAIRLWPILGIICFLLPIIWTGVGKSNVGAMGYLFSVWAVLILGGALLSRRLRYEAGGAEALLDTRRPDTEQAGTGRPDTGRPNTERPDIGQADTDQVALAGPATRPEAGRKL